MKGDKLGELAVRIAQISDTHITKFGMHIPEFLDSCIRIINSLDPAPDIVIHTGDLTDNGVLLDYELAVEKMEEVEPDILYLPGNHDERNYGDSLFREMVSKTDVLNSFKRVAVLVLDSAIPDTDNGRLGRWRRELLKTSFQAFSENVLKVVAFHHHLIPVPFAGREKDILEDAGDVLKTVVDAGVDIVLMGHRHVRNAITVGNTLMVNAGTVSSVRTRGRLGNSFNLLDVTEEGEVAVYEVQIPSGEIRQLGLYSLKRYGV
jgi:Icc protein